MSLDWAAEKGGESKGGGGKGGGGRLIAATCQDAHKVRKPRSKRAVDTIILCSIGFLRVEVGIDNKKMPFLENADSSLQYGVRWPHVRYFKMAD